MLNQQQLIEAARVAIARREGKPEVTYYRVGKLLGITSAYMANLTGAGKAQAIMSAELAHKLARLADIDPAYAMACIEAERAARDQLETSGTWRVIAEALGGKAASILLAACLAFGGAEVSRASGNIGISGTAPAGGQRASMYIMASQRRRLIFALRQYLAGCLSPPPFPALDCV